MTTSTADMEEMAKGLSDEAKTVLRYAGPNPTLPHEHWTQKRTAEFALAELAKAGLIWHFSGDGSNPVTMLGMQVRQHLLTQQEPSS